MSLSEVVIGIDMNGGDHLAKGAFNKSNPSPPSFRIIDALKIFSSKPEFSDAKFVLVGDLPVFEDYLAKSNIDPSRIKSVLKAPGTFKSVKTVTLSNGEKGKREEASLTTLLDLFPAQDIQGKIDCAFSLGETAALVYYSQKEVGIIPGISIKLPPLVATIPSANGKSFLFLDVGATVDPEPLVVYQYAVLAKIYAEATLNIKNPEIGVLSNGTEVTKGNAFAKSLDLLLKNHNKRFSLDPSKTLNYVGFVEGKGSAHPGIFGNVCDIVLTDGFTGNTNLKILEGIIQCLRAEIPSRLNFLDYVGLALAVPFLYASGTLPKLMSDFSTSRYNGAPLLGLNQCVVKGHGGSSTNGIVFGLEASYKYAKSKAVDKIKELYASDVVPNSR